MALTSLRVPLEQDRNVTAAARSLGAHRNTVLHRIGQIQALTGQTPYRGHPVFVAQHATATCCRSCLLRWHEIPKGRELTAGERAYVVDVIIRWMQRELRGS
jgi:Domain of unknown function (DUF4186)/PucR C-terminal helix-turn-helix domain